LAVEIIPAKAAPRKKRQNNHWGRIRISVQILAFALFLVVFIATQKDGWSYDLVNIPIRLSPLTMLAQMIASRTFLLASSLALILIILSLVVGRAWCGWLCPMGSALDLFSLKRWRKARSEPNQGWRSVKYALLLIILVAALLGNLTLLVLDPLTIMTRTLATSIWPALDRMVTAVEMVLIQVPFLSDTVSNFDGLIRPAVFPSMPLYYADALLFGVIFAGIIGLNLLAERFWCRYLCPLGGLLGILSKFSLFRREVAGECKGCNLCDSACPTGTIDPNNGYASDPSECTLCLDCLDACPRASIKISRHLSPARWNEYDPHRRELLAALGLGIPMVAIFRSTGLAKSADAYLIRPPGSTESDLLSKCIRCDECVRSCPTGGLQPSLTEAGLEGLWTPVLMPRLGYCDYSCNTCGQVCPVQAIPKLSLEDKRKQIIGKAYIDKNRCIAWADDRPCIVCEEMCPLAEKAIRLNQAQIVQPDGSTIQIKQPVVLRDLCIGCGICEYKCPVSGPAAIRIYHYEKSIVTQF
jgi:polyferredoxin